MTLVAGVDSSTQSCKVVVKDAATGALVRSGRATHPDGTEVDPRHWWTALTEAIALAGGLDDVAALAVGGQQHGMVALDADGVVVRDALLWNDTRSAQAATDLIAELGEGDAAGRGRRLGRGDRLGPRRELHDHQAPLAARQRAGEGRPGRGGRPPPRLADLASGRLRPRRRGRRPGPLGPDDRPLRRLGHRLLVPHDRGLPP